MSEKKDENILEKIVDNDKPVKTNNLRRRWTPKALALYILENAPGYVFLSSIHIKKKFPRIKIGYKKIEKLINHPDFDNLVSQYFNTHSENKKDAGKRFDLLVDRYYEANMRMSCPSHKSIEFFGRYSGKYDTIQKTDINIYNLNPEQLKRIGEAKADALANRFKREKEGDNGD